MQIIPGPLRAAGRSLLNALGLLQWFREGRARLERDLFTLRQNRLTESEIDAIYGELYHEKANYGREDAGDSGWEPDSVIKAAHAAAVLEALPGARKILVGGCSSGMAVLAFRNAGADAWGFDISADLDKMVLPEARPFVRRGSMLDMPFGPEDAFDCLVTTDVLEHVQMKNVGRMMAEMGRLNCRWMAHLINHTSMQPDHMTLKPLSWWARKAAPYYRLLPDLRARETGNPRIYGLNGDPLHVFTFWERVRGGGAGS